ncbi:hypothetical protein BURPS1106B_2007 [Burkholderia pseudomallei 1106b]|nr:hypothetical protein BURPS1106B_2007 [Burkholderia pseudomallei 1106b]
MRARCANDRRRQAQITGGKPELGESIAIFKGRCRAVRLTNSGRRAAKRGAAPANGRPRRGKRPGRPAPLGRRADEIGDASPAAARAADAFHSLTASNRQFSRD